MKYPDLNEFEKLIEKYPPLPKHRQRRREAMNMITPYARRTDMGAGHKNVIDYYRRRVDKVIREIPRTKVSTGVMIWKLHSSGFIFKTPKTVFAFDLIDSVVKEDRSNDLLENPDTWDRPPEQTSARLYMTARQRKALAKSIKYVFYTHQHRDHISWDLPRLIAEAGNKVIVTPAIRRAWAKYDFADKLVVPDHTDAIRIAPPLVELGPLSVRVHRGYQIGSGGGEAQCNAYLVTTDNGVNVYAKGDASDTGFANWLVRQHSFGAKVDLYLGNLFWGGSLEEITRLFDCFLLPGHDWDMIHGPMTPASFWWYTGPWAGIYDQLDWQFVRERAEFITWGERYHFVPHDDAPKGGLVLARERSEVVGSRTNNVETFIGREQVSDPVTGAEWSWRGRTLQVRPPGKATPGATSFGIYSVNLAPAGEDPVLKTGLALAREQERGTSKSFILRVRASDGWGEPGQVLYETCHGDRDPVYAEISLAGYAGRRVHLILEVTACGTGQPPVVWLLNPYIASQKDI